MNAIRKVGSTWPVTLVMLASISGFMAAQMAGSSPWAPVLFYLLALPYYLTALIVTALGQVFGFQLGWGGVLGLALLTDSVRALWRRRMTMSAVRDAQHEHGRT